MNAGEKRLGYDNLVLCSGGPMAKPGAVSHRALIASFRLECDVSPLFPYINAVAEKPELYNDPRVIRFMFERCHCVLYPEKGIATPLCDRRRAEVFLDRLLLFLEGISRRRDEINPSYRLFHRTSVLDILKLLPQSNCRECGFASCLAFAARLSIRDCSPEDCPYMGRPVAEQAIYPVYDSAGRVRKTVTIGIDTARADRARVSRENPVARSRKKFEEPSEINELGRKRANAVLPSPLTGREVEVLNMITHGHTNTEIARSLEISPHTVKSHVIHIFNKLGVNDRTQAAVWAARQDLI